MGHAKKDPLFPATFHQGCPYLTIIYLAVNYILTLPSVSGSLGVRFPRGPQGRGPAPSPSRTPPVQWAPFPSPARGSGRTPMCSDGTAGGCKPHRQSGQAGSRRARFGLAQISAAKTGRPWPIGFCGWTLEADWPVCRGLIIPSGDRLFSAVTGTKGRALSAITRAGAGIPGTGIGPPQDRPGAAHPRQRIQSWGSFALGGNITSSETATGKSSLRLKNSEPSPLRVLRNIAPTR